MRILFVLSVLLCLLSGCTTTELEPLSGAQDQTQKATVNLTDAQKAYFVSAVLSTPTSKLETELTKKLAPLGVFNPAFNFYELASAAYELVLERPTDMSRWRAVAKLDSFDSGVFAPGYQAARADALRRNPNLFSSCPSFSQWSAQYHQELRNSS